MAEISYQENMKRLTAIVEALEKSEMDLERSVALFEEGMALVKACEEKLEAVEKKVMLLTEEDTEIPFEGDYDV